MKYYQQLKEMSTDTCYNVHESLKTLCLSEESQPQKTSYCMIPLIRNTPKMQESRLVVARNWWEEEGAGS